MAAQQFATFLQRYRDSELTDEAMFRRGQALAKAGKLPEAQAALQELLEKRPTSPFKTPAAVELASVQAQLGQKAGPPPPVVDTSRMSEEEKNKAAAAMAEASARAGQWGEAMRWGARALETAPAAEREGRVKFFEQALEAAPARDVAKLVSELDRKSPAWPAAALKLARIQLHVGDRAHAADLARDVLAADAQGPYADGARAVQQAAAGSETLRPTLLGVMLPLTGDLKGFRRPGAERDRPDARPPGPRQGAGGGRRFEGEPDAAAEAVEKLAQSGAIAILRPLGSPKAWPRPPARSSSASPCSRSRAPKGSPRSATPSSATCRPPTRRRRRWPSTRRRS